MRNSNSIRKSQGEDTLYILRRFRSQSTIAEGKRQDSKLTKMYPPQLDTTENVRLMQFVSRNLFIYSLSCLPWIRDTFIHKQSEQASGIPDFVITRSLHRSHLNKGCIHPVTMLQNWKNVQCSIGILCVTFSTSIPSSDKWNPLKNSKDSWFGA